MSAFYSFRYSDQIRVLTDGGVFDQDGCLFSVERKIFRARGLSLVMTGRGQFADVLAVYDDVVIGFEGKSVDELLKLFDEYFLEACMLGNLDGCEFLIAAYSETLGPVHRFVACHGSYVGVVPFKMVDLGIQMAGGPPIDVARLEARGVRLSEHDQPYFPVKYGVAIMDAFREVPATGPACEEPGIYIGGRVDLTTVSASGVTFETLHTCNDPIGVRINSKKVSSHE